MVLQKSTEHSSTLYLNKKLPHLSYNTCKNFRRTRSSKQNTWQLTNGFKCSPVPNLSAIIMLHISLMHALHIDSPTLGNIRETLPSIEHQKDPILEGEGTGILFCHKPCRELCSYISVTLTILSKLWLLSCH